MADASEHTELMELSQLFGSQRMSSIPVGLYVKFEVSQENIQKAELARQEREERDRVREERRLRLAQQIAERKARVIGRNEQAKIDLRNSLFPCLVEIHRAPPQSFVQLRSGRHHVVLRSPHPAP